MVCVSCCDVEPEEQATIVVEAKSDGETIEIAQTPDSAAVATPKKTATPAARTPLARIVAFFSPVAKTVDAKKPVDEWLAGTAAANHTPGGSYKHTGAKKVKKGKKGKK